MFKQILFFALITLALGKPELGFWPRARGGRIVGGEIATIEECPYQVSFRYYDEHMCGGSIVSTTKIVTAAHCTDGLRATRMTVSVGSADVTGGEIHQVEYFYQHPLYNDATTDYDISMLTLTIPLTFSDKVKPIPLQPADDDVRAGTVARISGWGGLYEGDEETPMELRKVDVDVISEEECKDAYGSTRITSRMMCAKRTGKDSCQGDSGGPLVADGKLVGVVSWGIGCARPHYPGVYTQVSYMNRWINSNM